jgi:hypothetical protein
VDWSRLSTGTWVVVILGLLVGLGIVVVIVIDVCLYAAHVNTISDRLLRAATKNPGWAALASAIVCLPLGMLLGHLFFPQAGVEIRAAIKGKPAPLPPDTMNGDDLEHRSK